MVKTYTKKATKIDAIQFLYTTECIEYLKTWLGDNFINYGKARNPDAFGWIEFWTGDPVKCYSNIAFEGDYIIKDISGKFIVIKKNIFENDHECVD